MKITDWFQEIKEQNVRLNTVQLGLVRESIHLEGNSVTVTLGRESGIESITPNGASYKIEIGETPRHLGLEFSTLFRKNSEDFANLLDSLKRQVDEIVNAVTELFSAIIDQDIPELMLERISGTQMGKEPTDLVKKTAETRFKKLMLKLADFTSPYESLDWWKTIAKKKLEIKLYSLRGPDYYIRWDNLHMDKTSLEFQPEPALTQCLLFLANYEKISASVEKFATAVKASAKILAD